MGPGQAGERGEAEARLGEEPAHRDHLQVLPGCRGEEAVWLVCARDPCLTLLHKARVLAVPSVSYSYAVELRASPLLRHRFWQCPNGKECKYKHALPPGYVLKSQMKVRSLFVHGRVTRKACGSSTLGISRLQELLEAEAANTRPIEDLIEEERSKVDAKTPITEVVRLARGTAWPSLTLCASMSSGSVAHSTDVPPVAGRAAR